MTKEDKIKNILLNAQEQILEVLREDSISLSDIAANIDATADKIMNDAFSAKTILADENNIDAIRYGMLDYIPAESVLELFESCKHWCVTGDFEPESKYLRFCTDMAKVMGTAIEDELKNNVNVIIYKYKLNVNDTGSSN